MKHPLRVALVSCSTFIILSQTGLAQSQTAEIDELRQRVDALEAELEEGRPNLSFGIAKNTSIEIYGFARFEAFYDFDFEQGDLSRASRVGDPEFATDGEFDTSVRVSRFGIRTSTDTGIGPIETQLEFDLFGSGGDDSSSPNLRLRHANINIDDQVLLGQFWTNFMPLVHYPTTADFNGPVGITFARVPQARYTYRTENGFTFSGSVEESNGGASDPVFTAAALYTGDNFSLRAAGLTGTFNDNDETFDTNGFTLSGSVSLWEGGSLTGTYVTGDALGNLLIGGGDRVVGGETNSSDGFTLALSQKVTDKVTLNLAYGDESYDLATQIGSSNNAFTDLQSVHATVFYNPVERLTLAAEYINIQSDGPDFSAEADRIGLSATFSF
ncbi:MAG: DcaP family trimeric outer membrane transporter [Pseudomonadota bacterium]